MAVDIQGHCDRGMTEPLLDDFDRQLKASINLPIDAPSGEEMAEGMQARILGNFRNLIVGSLPILVIPAAICGGHKPTYVCPAQLAQLVVVGDR
jgi:hypothetical protein